MIFDSGDADDTTDTFLGVNHPNHLARRAVAHAQDVDAVSRCPSHLTTVEVVNYLTIYLSARLRDL